MTAKTLTISLNEEDWEYLQKDELLSPTAIFRSALHHIKEGRKGLEQLNKQLIAKNKALQDKVFELQDDLENKK